MEQLKFSSLIVNQSHHKVDDSFQLKKLTEESSMPSSTEELETFFDDLKSGVLIVDSEFKLIYKNNTIQDIFYSNESELQVGALVLDFIKKILSPTAIISFLEGIIERKDVLLSEGVSASRVGKILLKPIPNEGFIVKIILDEDYSVSASNLFRSFPNIGVAYFGFDIELGKKMNIRFVSENFNVLFPDFDKASVINDESYFISRIYIQDLPEFLIKMQNARRDQKSWSSEFRVFDKQGNFKWYRLIAGTFSEYVGKNFWLGYIEDINIDKTAIIEKERLIHETLDDERNRIAMELHDGLGQHLVALNLYISQLNSQNEQEIQIKQICKQIVTDSMLQMKTLCYNLAPPELEAGLMPGLDAFFGKLNEFSMHINYEFHAKVSASREIDTDMSFNLFRIIQEFVTNSQKYSNCQHVVCEVFVRNNKISILIFDDGDGYDENTITHGFGINNMLKRAKILGAKINLESTLGEGTKMLLEI
jgi:signal transduction histidine kinase